MAPFRIATLPGSLRAGSFNRKLLKLADAALEAAGVELDRLDLRDFPLPLYDGDLEAEKGLPPEAWTLKARLAAAHGVIIACPEYNWGVPGTFKNAIDWTSRGGNPPWAGKIVGLMGATNGPWGTWRGMPHLRQSLTSLNAIVIPQQINLANAGTVWDAEDHLKDDTLPLRVDKFVQSFLAVLEKLKA
jgi:chromate reductase, NAD(P)H dehydrogenase (quinone)